MARSEAVDTVAAIGAAGAKALTKSRKASLAEGRAEGFAAGLAQKTAERSGVRLREAFAAYVVSAHEQKLRVVAKEKVSSADMARGLSSELASAREMLAGLLQERIAEMQDRRDSALSEIAAAAAAAPDAKLPLNLPGLAPWPGTAAADVAADALKVVTNAPFWQECGGGV
ncbi:unnamed protein product [Laminaria digitata]